MRLHPLRNTICFNEGGQNLSRGGAGLISQNTALRHAASQSNGIETLSCADIQNEGIIPFNKRFDDRPKWLLINTHEFGDVTSFSGLLREQHPSEGPGLYMSALVFQPSALQQ